MAANGNGAPAPLVNTNAMQASGHRVPVPEVALLRFYPGEDIVDRLLAISHTRNRDVRIVSATGRIARVNVTANDRSEDYVGNYMLLSLNGSVTPLYFNGISATSSTFNISLDGPDGTVIAGRTSDRMVVASETTVVVSLSPPGHMHDVIDDNGPEMSDE